jgi:hypothetical protein
MPARILCRDQPRFQGGDLRHRLGWLGPGKCRDCGFSIGEIPRAAQSINHAHGLFDI